MFGYLLFRKLAYTFEQVKQYLQLISQENNVAKSRYNYGINSLVSYLILTVITLALTDDLTFWGFVIRFLLVQGLFHMFEEIRTAIYKACGK